MAVLSGGAVYYDRGTSVAPSTNSRFFGDFWFFSGGSLRVRKGGALVPRIKPIISGPFIRTALTLLSDRVPRLT